MTPRAPAALPSRHYGLDWLRIGAFAILILYHVALVFVPWPYHAKLPGAAWISAPMLAVNPWRLALLFVVSGYATRALLARSEIAAFARNRSARLLIPLAFGIAVIVPPQSWVELVSQHGYRHGFMTFWSRDYFAFAPVAGIGLPAWNHLWFVAYLWSYTMLLVIAIALTPPRLRAVTQRAFDALARGGGVLWIPMAWLVAVTGFWFAGHGETQALLGDGVAHATYLPAFLFGFALAGTGRALPIFAHWWKVMLALALVSYALSAYVDLAYPVARPWLLARAFAIARGVQGWSAIAAMIGMATRFWNHDHPWRATLTEAVFPFYVIHQTIIVLVAYRLAPLALPAGVNFAILVAATVVGCWAFYRGGRAVAPLRPLIGLRPVPRPTMQAAGGTS